MSDSHDLKNELIEAWRELDALRESVKKTETLWAKTCQERDRLLNIIQQLEADRDRLRHALECVVNGHDDEYDIAAYALDGDPCPCGQCQWSADGPQAQG